ncbi:endonuclease/exonuclease/phosphatase family protein [Streptomyces sp. NPDC057757]|uniref:endonuclease/exonuclease/phosphatase family protein n=1 Tax=Streptomyces sp. NPDC057757 TaxID=3346241 RepID=UPI0036BE12D3
MTSTHSIHHEPVITVITLNLERDGGADENGRPPARWRAAHELLKAHRPDVLLRQEMTYSRAHGQRRLHEAERLLDMRGFNGAPGSGNNPTGLFVRPTVFDVREQVEHAPLWRTPPTHIVASLREVPEVRIVMMSCHLAFNSPRGRERETDEILAAADKINQGAAFLVGGDFNEYPHPAGERVPPIDWTDDGITDRMHMMHRTNRSPDGTRTSCTYADETLLAAGLHDPARYAAHTLHQPDALWATAGQNKPSQGGPRRIDRIYVDPWLINAVLEVSIIDTPDSDHDGLKVVYSRAGMAQALRRKVARRAAYNLAF